MTKILTDANGDLYRAHLYEKVSIDDLKDEIESVKDIASKIEDTIEAAEKLQTKQDDGTEQSAAPAETQAPAAPANPELAPIAQPSQGYEQPGGTVLSPAPSTEQASVIPQ